MHLPRTAALASLLCICSISALALEINTANEAELDSVKGLGPSATARILAAREQAPFKDWADLMQRVKGIKPRTAAKLSEAGLSVNQQPYSASHPGAKAP
jgi:competence protein ComEA